MTNIKTTSQKNKGTSLIELMVGLAIGLLTVAIAMGALMSSRNVTSSVQDSTLMQQQASYVFRNIGQQFRQAGSLRLNLATNKAATDAISFDDPVGFDLKTSTFDPKVDVIGGIKKGTIDSYFIHIGYQNYKELYHTNENNDAESIFRDCLGQQSNNDLIISRYLFENNELLCTGSSAATPQSLARNVADFKIKYIKQSFSNGETHLQYIKPEDFDESWSSIRGIEVCLVIFGDEIIETTADAKYEGCDDEVKYADLTGTRRNKVHKKYISTYQLRSVGLI